MISRIELLKNFAKLEDISRTYAYISHLHVHYKNEFFLMQDFISILKKEDELVLRGFGL